jgi:(1->4)-alpha-D-glucan 1-alpha-D-glucosylmutase
MSVAPRFPLRATYRLQLREEFTFDAAIATVPQIAALGISHLYLSPVFEARAGSTHGYDATDPSAVRRGLGGEAGFARLVDAARAHGVGILLDIVPNHMAASEENVWFRDVLEFGPDSPFTAHLDLSWRADPTEPRVVLPVLGRPLAECIDAGELRVRWDELGFGISYHERRFPVSPLTYATLLDEIRRAAGRVADSTPAEAERLRSILDRFHTSDARAARSARDELIRLAASVPEVRVALEARAAEQDVAALHAQQHYRLEHWRSVDTLLSYRRFFDITDLIGVRVEDDRVFRDVHARILEWIRGDRVTGVRIDHIDGLLDPTGYLIRLRQEIEAAAPERPVPLLVEKILGHGESLPAPWPADGTTGYEFLNAVNGLFIDEAGLEIIKRTYAADTGERSSFADVVYAKKRLVLEQLFAGEWRVLTREFDALVGESTIPDADDLANTSRDALHAALREVTACLAVYRTYIRSDDPPDAEDVRRIREAAGEARRRGGAPAAAIERVAAILLLEPESGVVDSDARTFVMRWQQLTGPAMAKGLEDTALYTYFPLVSANDVGGDPDRAVCAPGELHAFLAERCAHMPDALNATSTHDTKRSEDVRARINVLSEVPDEWTRCWQRWRQLNARFREASNRPSAPEEYLLYQTMVGAWPMDSIVHGDFAKRIRRYMQKAMREAKATTSWLEPDDLHERAVAAFIDRILNADANAEFVSDVDAFVAQIAPHGVLNSLAQTAIKAWAPGIPDFYQGTESWAFDLVDPDNRRPVDYPRRERLLADGTRYLENPHPDTLPVWLDGWRNGRIKVLVTLAALRERTDRAELFAYGDYTPLEFEGAGAQHAFGFLRHHERDWCALIVPRLTAKAGAAAEELLRATRARLPAGAPARWTDLLTGSEAHPEDALPWPVGLLRGYD